MKPEQTDRTTELRRALVSTVDTAAYPRTIGRARIAIASVAAFAIAGAITGGVSVAAVSQQQPQAQEQEQSEETIGLIALSSARPNSVLAGDPFHLIAAGTAQIALGPQPSGANGLAVRFECESAGIFQLSVDSRDTGRITCDEPSGGGGWVDRVDGDGDHVLGIETGSEGEYQLWAAWVTEPAVPEASSQQLAEIEDGVVTRDEYVAAFNRFIGCMGAAGYDLSTAPQTATVFTYAVPDAAVTDGTDERCYLTQFKQVDMIWQVANGGS
jgi:hypothetical protein